MTRMIVETLKQRGKIVVVGIGKKWPPQEMNLLQVRLAGKITKKAEGILLSSVGRQVFNPGKNGLPLEVKRY